MSAESIMDEFSNLTNETADASYDELMNVDLFEFVVHGILLNLVGFMGIIGNVISMIILSRPQMRSSINYLLIGLARCDTVLIITSMFLFGLPAIYKYTRTDVLFAYQHFIYPRLCLVVYPAAVTAQTVSVYLTLTVTLERFVAVCHPLKARSLCTYGRAKLYVVLIIILSTLYNLPRFWEISLSPMLIPQTNTTFYRPAPTELRQTRIYISVYIHWLYFVFIYLLPFSCLAILNAAIYRQVQFRCKIILYPREGMIISIINTSTIRSLIVLTHLCIVKIHKSPDAHPDEPFKA